MEFGDRPPDPNLPYYRSLKTSFASVLKMPEKREVIADAVCTVDKIVSNSMMFLKLYLIHNKNDSPVVTVEFVDTIFKTVCQQTSIGRPPSADMKVLRTKLSAFYDEHFAPLLPQNEPALRYTHLNTVLDYEAVKLVTVFENNIKQHYVEYVESYVNAVWQKTHMIECIRRLRKTKSERETAIRKMMRTLRCIKTDLLNVGTEPFTSHPSYHEWIRINKAFVLPAKTNYTKDLLYYDIQCSPQDYFPAMMRITSYIETVEKKNRSVCPLRRSVIPKHITLDTTTLVHLMYTKDIGKKSKLLTKGELVRNKEAIWDVFFKTSKKMFSTKDYRFNQMMDTDGVSCSILMIRKDLYGKRAPKRKQKFAREEYIDDLEAKDSQRLRERKVVGIDPNMSDLLFCTNEDASKQYRYTQNQRRKETKSKKYQQIALNEKNHTLVDGSSIVAWETRLSAFDHKTVAFDGFKAYVQEKLLVNSRIAAFYRQRIFRKLKLNTFYNTRKSEQRMIERFKEIFGSPEQVVIGIGDWEQKKHRKFKEPIKGKGFRTTLRKGGFKVYLVDEFRTSCQCSHCQEEAAKCEKFRVRLDPNTKKDDSDRHLRLVHGLLACKTCGRVWNRDVNSAINIARITRESIECRGRPTFLSRQSNPPSADSGVTSTSHNQNLHEDAKPQH